MWPDKRIDLYFPGARALTGAPSPVWATVHRRLLSTPVGLHGGHRAELPDGFTGEKITAEPVHWATGQPDVTADAVLWAVRRVRPNTAWFTAGLLDEHGFVRVTNSPFRASRDRDRRRAATDPLQLGPQPGRRRSGPQRAGLVQRKPPGTYRPAPALGIGARRTAGRSGVFAPGPGLPIPGLVDRPVLQYRGSSDAASIAESGIRVHNMRLPYAAALAVLCAVGLAPGAHSDGPCRCRRTAAVGFVDVRTVVPDAVIDCGATPNKLRRNPAVSVRRPLLIHQSPLRRA